MEFSIANSESKKWLSFRLRRRLKFHLPKTEGELYADTQYTVCSPGPSYGRVSVLSLKDGSIVAQHKLKMKFDLLSVTNGAQFLWLTQAHDAKDVSVFSTDKKLQEIERFKIPKYGHFSFMDAQLGLIFTESRSKDDKTLLLSCWKLECKTLAGPNGYST